MQLAAFPLTAPAVGNGRMTDGGWRRWDVTGGDDRRKSVGNVEQQEASDS